MTSSYFHPSLIVTNKITGTYGPIVAAALWRAGVRGKVDVHQVMAVIMESRGGKQAFVTLTWSDLTAIVAEAWKTAKADPRRWNGRAWNYDMGMMTEQIVPTDLEAVADDTIASLAYRS